MAVFGLCVRKVNNVLAGPEMPFRRPKSPNLYFSALQCPFVLLSTGMEAVGFRLWDRPARRRNIGKFISPEPEGTSHSLADVRKSLFPGQSNF